MLFSLNVDGHNKFMQVIDLGSKSFYRWRVEVPRHNKSPWEDVKKWASDREINCTIIPGLAFFREERDAILFVLTWS